MVNMYYRLYLEKFVLFAITVNVMGVYIQIFVPLLLQRMVVTFIHRHKPYIININYKFTKNNDTNNSAAVPSSNYNATFG